MFGFKRIAVFTTLIVSTFVSAAPHKTYDDESLVDWDRLSSLLDSIDDNVLHSVLHNLSPKFRDGIFSKNRAAIEHVHTEQPLLASKLVYMAKRQSNATTTIQTTIASSEPASVSSSISSQIQSALASQITATTQPSPTTVLVAPAISSNEVAISTVSGAVVVSTEGGGIVTRTSSGVAVSFSQSTSTRLFYSTADNGQVATSTSLVVVNAPVTATADATGAAGAAQSSSSPGLRNIAGRTTPDNFILGCLGTVFTATLGLMALL